MKKRLLTAAACLCLLAAGSVYASADYTDAYADDQTGNYTDYGYGTNYGYDTDYGYDTNTGTYDDPSAYPQDTYDPYGLYTSSADPTSNRPAVLKLDATPITDNKFSAQLKIDCRSLIVSADITITYDPKVVKLLKVTPAQDTEDTSAAAGTTAAAAAAEIESGIIKFSYSNPAGSDSKDEYLTLDFEVIDLTERTTALYMNVNSLTDNTNTELTATADGTIIQIKGAVEVDASADESMYPEISLPLTAQPITLEALGLADAKTVSFADNTVAEINGSDISTLSEGITNMTVEMSNGKFRYYRLVVTEKNSSQTAPAAPPAAEVATQPSEPQITLTETNNSKKIKYIVIYFAVIIAVAAVFIEFFVICGNPYAQTAAILRQRRETARRIREYEENDDYNTIPESDIDDTDDDESADEEFAESSDELVEEESVEFEVETEGDENAEGDWSESYGDDDDGAIDEFYKKLDSGELDEDPDDETEE